MRSYAAICGHMQPYAAICGHMRPYATTCIHILQKHWPHCGHRTCTDFPSAAACSHMRPYATICGHMQPHASIYCKNIGPTAGTVRALTFRLLLQQRCVAIICGHCGHRRTYAAICGHMRPYAAICTHMHPYIAKTSAPLRAQYVH